MENDPFPFEDLHKKCADFNLFQTTCGSSSKSSNNDHANHKDISDIGDVSDVSDVSDISDFASDEEEHDAFNDDNDQEPPAKMKRSYIFHKNRDLEDPAEIRTEQDFALVFRMSRATFELLLDMVWNKFPRLGLSPNGKSLTPRKRLLMFLHMAGSDTAGIYRRHNYQLASGTINDNIKVCIDVLYQGNYNLSSDVYNLHCDYPSFLFMMIFVKKC